MPSNRLEAFSDGVFAIAATLLVLELHVPTAGSGPLWPQIVARWASYACYVVSFLTIGIIWVNHHSLFALVNQGGSAPVVLEPTAGDGRVPAAVPDRAAGRMGRR
jgi:uncharacterized membrane protein